MSNTITFMNQDNYLIIIAGALLLWSIFVWKESRNKDQKGLWLQILVSCITVLSLTLIILKPAYDKEISVGQGVILTEGFQPELLDSMWSKNKELRVVDYHPKKSLKPILDSIKSAVVLGYGIEPYDLWQFDGLPTTYLPGKTQEGLTRLRYADKAVIGSEINVTGAYASSTKGYFLILTDPGGNTMDSVVLNNEKLQKFSLSGELKVAGRLVYHLIEKDSSGNILLQEPLPIVVSENRSLSVLMINTYPTFESKYLKNFLLSRGHKLIVRNQLTKNRYKFEYYNTPKSPIYGLTSAMLENFDLIVMDVDAYLDLSTASKNTVQQAIGASGLGLFLQPNDAYFTLPESKSFFKVKKDAISQILMDGKLNTVVQKYPYEFELSAHIMPIDLNSNMVIGAATYIGLGKVASTNLKDTYQLVLSGKKNRYDAIWTTMLESISKKEKVTAEWEAQTAYPRINEPFNFELHYTDANPSVLNKYQSEIPLVQDAQVNSKWKGVDYPRNFGWNTLKVENDSIADYDYYVFDSVQRSPLRNRLKTNANFHYFGSEKINESPKAKSLTSVPLVWFYLLFLFGIGYLWLKPKVSS